MKFCTDHWAQLRDAIKSRGLDALIPDTGEQALANLVSQTQDGTTVDNFDPLMGAHNAIVARTMDIIHSQYGQNPMLIFSTDPAHPEWQCAICALNWCHTEHLRTCTTPGCEYPKEHDWTSDMIDGSADFMVTQWRKLGA